MLWIVPTRPGGLPVDRVCAPRATYPYGSCLHETGPGLLLSGLVPPGLSFGSPRKFHFSRILSGQIEIFFSTISTLTFSLYLTLRALDPVPMPSNKYLLLVDGKHRSRARSLDPISILYYVHLDLRLSRASLLQ